MVWSSSIGRQKTKQSWLAQLPVSFLHNTHIAHKKAVHLLRLCNFKDNSLYSAVVPRSGELRMQKLKSRQVRTQSLNVLPLKPGVGQYITLYGYA